MVFGFTAYIMCNIMCTIMCTMHVYQVNGSRIYSEGSMTFNRVSSLLVYHYIGM